MARSAVSIVRDVLFGLCEDSLFKLDVPRAKGCKEAAELLLTVSILCVAMTVVRRGSSVTSLLYYSAIIAR